MISLLNQMMDKKNAGFFVSLRSIIIQDSRKYDTLMMDFVWTAGYRVLVSLFFSEDCHVQP